VEELKKDINECFNRIRKLETASAVLSEKDKVFIEKLDLIQNTFNAHDKKEMEIYDKLQLDVNKIYRFLYIATGIGLTLQFLGLHNILNIIGNL